MLPHLGSIRNHALKDRVTVRCYAGMRWQELGGTGDLAESIKNAVPLGPALGGRVVLVNGDFAFPTYMHNGERVVVSCIRPPSQDEITAATTNLQAVGDFIDEALLLVNKSDDEITAMCEAGGEIYKQLGTRESPSNWQRRVAKAKKRLGRILQMLQYNLGLRKKIKQTREHADRMEKNKNFLHKAIKELLPEDQYKAVLALRNEKEEQYNTKKQTNCEAQPDGN